jgi:ribosomal protein S11
LATPKVKKARRRERGIDENGVAHIQATFNNTIVTIADPAGAVVSCSFGIGVVLTGTVGVAAHGVERKRLDGVGISRVEVHVLAEKLIRRHPHVFARAGSAAPASYNERNAMIVCDLTSSAYGAEVICAPKRHSKRPWSRAWRRCSTPCCPLEMPRQRPSPST